jgi:hypothetical protein
VTAPGQDPNDVLFGGGVPAVKFKTVGDSVSGLIVKLDAQQQTKYNPKGDGPGEPLFWDEEKTRPKMQVIATLQTTDRDPSDDSDDGRRRVFIKGKNLQDGVKAAVRRAGGQKLELGGRLTVEFAGEQPSDWGGAAAKLYHVEYEKPQAEAANVALGLGQQAAQTTDNPWGVESTPAPVHPTAGQLDLDSLPTGSRAMIEKMLAQQGGTQ